MGNVVTRKADITRYPNQLASRLTNTAKMPGLDIDKASFIGER